MRNLLNSVAGVLACWLLSGCVISQTPVIKKIDPPMGPTYGGYQMVIYGENIDDDPMVFLGNRKLKIKKIEHIDKITVEIPQSGTGKVAVVVQNEDNSQAVAANGFEYMRFPYIKSVVPSSGPASGGTWLKIAGDNFDPNAKLYFGKTVAKNPKITDSQIMVIAPPGVLGMVKISITNPNGNSHIFKNFYNYK